MPLPASKKAKENESITVNVAMLSFCLVLEHQSHRRHQTPDQEAKWDRCVGIERHRCRESRDGPGMALHGVPLEQVGWTTRSLSTVTPAFQYVKIGILRRPLLSVSPLRRVTFSLLAKEKVTKEKARPAYGFRCAQLPSLRHCSEDRREGPSLAHYSSFGIHAKRPSPQHLHSAS